MSQEKNIEMQSHLIKTLNRFSLRSDVINKLIINPVSYIFREDTSEEEKWEYYNSICRELKISNRVLRMHGMDSNKASTKKNYGHDEEKRFAGDEFIVKKGNKKTDIEYKDGRSYASIKAGKKIQWGMHVINELPERFQELFSLWISTFEKNYVSLDNRISYADDIMEKLKDKETRCDLLNYYMRKNELVPYLIVKDLVTSEYIRVEYEELINVLCNNIIFYHTKKKVKIVAQIKLEKPITLFEIEPRSDKNNAILMHGHSKVIINSVKYYNVDVKERY
jgi:hypothetical protein